MTSVEERVRAALSATTAGIRPDEEASLERITARTAVARRRRRVAVLGAAVFVAAVAVVAAPQLRRGERHVVEAGSESTTGAVPSGTAAPGPGTTTAGTGTVDFDHVFPLLPGEGTTDPIATAERFVHDWLGFPNAAIGEFVATGAAGVDAVPPADRAVAGEVPVRSRQQDGTPGRQVSVLSLRRVDATRPWYVTSARSEQVLVDTPAGGSVVASPVLVTGRGVGFENTVAVSVRDADGTLLGSAPTIAFAPDFTAPGPFEISLPFDPPASMFGAIVANTDIGAEFATPDFAVLPVRFATSGGVAP